MRYLNLYLTNPTNSHPTQLPKLQSDVRYVVINPKTGLSPKKLIKKSHDNQLELIDEDTGLSLTLPTNGTPDTITFVGIDAHGRYHVYQSGEADLMLSEVMADTTSSAWRAGASLMMTGTAMAYVNHKNDNHFQTPTPTPVPVNQAPTDVLISSLSLPEYQDGIIIGTLTAIDPDGGDVHTYQVDDERFEIIGDALKLKTGHHIDHAQEPTVSLSITATDKAGLSIGKNITLQVQDDPLFTPPLKQEATITPINSTTTKITNPEVIAHSHIITARGNKVYYSDFYGEYIDARDFGTDTTGQTDSLSAIKTALQVAHKEGVALYLSGKLYISDQIVFDKTVSNATGIFGDGQGNTIISFDKAQIGRHGGGSNDIHEFIYDNPDRPILDSMLHFNGILIDRLDGKFIKNLSVKYTADDFYRPNDTYFGKVSGIMVNNSDHTLIDNVEVTGANRAGINFVSSTATQKIPGTDTRYKTYLQDNNSLADDDPIASQVLGEHNQVINSNLHGNRVAGVLFAYQKNFIVQNNLLANNGHEADGGTGYGVASTAGTYNDHITYQNNTTNHNYRKGLDVHDANHITISHNTSVGDRLYGIAVYNRQFNMDTVAITDNIISQDSSFRLTKDDSPNLSYHGYAGIHLQTNTQADHKHFVGSSTATFDIKRNTISGMDVYNDAHHTYGIEFRNHEPNTMYALNIDDNTITGKETKYIIGIINNGVDYFNLDANGKATQGQGFGNINITNNTAIFETLKSPQGNETPINIQEDNSPNTARGNITIQKNNIQITKNSDSGTEMFQIIGNAKHIDISDNVLSMSGNINKSVFSILNQSQENSTVNIHHNQLLIDDTQKLHSGFIETYHQVLLNSHNNTVNQETISSQRHHHQLNAGEVLVLDAQNNVLKFANSVKGDIYLGQGSDELVIQGQFSGNIHTHQESQSNQSDKQDLPTDKNTLSLKNGIHGTSQNPATITAGDGLDTIVIEKDSKYAQIQTGGGRDVLAIRGHLDDSTINMGDGQDHLYLSGATKNNTIDLGDGVDVLVLEGQKIDDLIFTNPQTQKSEELAQYTGIHLSLSDVVGVEHLRLEGTTFYQYDPQTQQKITTTTQNSIDIQLSDVIYNGANKLFITGNDNDTVDFGNNGNMSLGGFVKYGNQSSDEHDIYYDGNNPEYLIYVDKDIQVI